MTQPQARYQCEDREILLGFYKKLIWNRMLTAIPEGVAPNAITIFGQLCVLAAVIFAYAASQGNTPLYLVSALLMMSYLTADNLDGPHARRTGQSSPLGEFLDHGLDGIGSGATLLVFSFTVRADGLYLLTLGLVGALAWIVVFWDQFRTGLLVIPRLSAVEGITLLALVQIAVVALGDPAWLRFSSSELTLGSALYLLCAGGYVGTAATPIWRAMREKLTPTEITPALLISASAMIFYWLGASALVCVLFATFYSADVVARMILKRHNVPGSDMIVSPLHAILLLPLIGAVFGSNAGWSPTHWATLSATVSTFFYLVTLLYGSSQLMARRRAESRL
ncbi:MAG: CDP-alcohol phosphatidyltransferase family protein [Myxococcales bacterium]|nr:CDP-alcohol phosphatidyltransferase family protein [Myxococcales bacterium]